MSEQTTTDVPATPSAPSVSAWAAEAFGELPQDSGGEPPASDPASAPSDAPSETPASGAAPDAETPASGTTDESAGTTPETPAAETDHFADTTPFSFTANGKDVSIEGIRVFKEGGAVIKDAQTLADLGQKLSERESLQERFHKQSHENQTLLKAVEWTDPTSNKTLTGPEAAIEMRVGNASLLAENQLLVATFLAEGVDLKPYLTTVKGPDGSERIVVAPDVITQLQRENALQQREAANAIRDHYKTTLSQVQAPAAPIDYAAEAPALIQQIAAGEKLDASVLTPSDRSVLAKQLAFHTRDGKVSVEWQELVKERIALRTETKAALASTATAASQAAKTATERMAAAARGVKPPAKPVAPTAPAKKPTPAQEKASSEADAFSTMLNAGAAALRASTSR